jgi:PAS domain S-box-containing protein
MSPKDKAPSRSKSSDSKGERVVETWEEHEERINLALDSAGIGTWNWKVMLNVVSWDERMHDLFGIERGTFPGTFEFFSNLLHPEDRERVIAAVTRSVDGDAQFDTEYRVVWPLDGGVHMVRARGKVYRDSEGKAERMTGACWDITDRWRTDQAFRESEERYGRLLDSVTDYVYTVKMADGRVLSTSHGVGCLAVTGYSPEEFQADSWLWHRIIHPDDRDAVVGNIARMIRDKAPVTIEHRMIRRDQAVRWVRNKQVPRHDSAGQLISYDGLVSDITDRKLVEEKVREVLADLTKSHEELKAAQMQLIEAEKLQSVGRLAAGVAHEVKNPLATLQMGIQCLRDLDLVKGDEAEMVVGEMQEAVRRASVVVGDLLNLSSPKELGMREAEINPLIEKSLRFVKHDLLLSKIQVVCQLAADLPRCVVDEGKIEQVLINLFTNACDAMPEHGTLTVTSAARALSPGEVAYEEGDRAGQRFRHGEKVVVIEVRDTGPGVPEDKMGRIFDPFFTTKPTGHGTGLGLSVARQIIELHKGRISIANSPGGGAVATILLKCL